MEKIFTELEKVSKKMVDAEMDHITLCTDGNMLFTSGLGSPSVLGETIAGYIIEQNENNWSLLDFLKDMVFEIEYQKRIHEAEEEDDDSYNMN